MVRRRGEADHGERPSIRLSLCLDLGELDHGLDEGIEEWEVDVRVDDEVGEVDAVGVADGLEAVGAEGPAQRGVAVCGSELGVEAVLAGVLVAARGASGAVAATGSRGASVLIHGDKGRGLEGLGGRGGWQQGKPHLASLKICSALPSCMVLGLRKSNTGREGADECAVSSVIPAVVRNPDGFADDVEQLGELVQIGIGVTEEGA